MRVYVNWETQEVVGPNQIETFIDQKLSDYLDDDDLFDEYLHEHNYTIVEVWYMDDKQRENVIEDYTAYKREYIEKQFDNNFCEYEVE